MAEPVDDFPTHENSPGGPPEGSTEGEVDLFRLFPDAEDREVVRWIAAVREAEG